MAKIVFGMAVPHSGMLGQAPEDWLNNGERDRNNPTLWYRNRTWTYPELEAERGAENFEPLLSIEERTARAARNAAALAEMRRAYQAADVDVAIILGKDQKEIFTHMSPSIAIYSGEDVHNGPPQRAVYAPDHAVTHKAHPELALHLIKSLEADGFDITDLFAWPDNVWMKPEPSPIVPHAYSFVYHQIMDDNPPPHVPIILNCFYDPTQPPMWRCIDFGDALLKAVKAWKSDARVAIIASGGLSHFVCDPEFDAGIIEMLRNYDYDGLAAVDERSYQSGTSEIKLYVSVLKALEDAGAEMTLVDYVPSYRTAAGTGEGMGFMYWTTGAA
ncbi:MAG: protocatechuate 3,4-dioxygenase [Alphaproteobacteria bacterium]|nr:MAG: protocatechuate 3,4-dioxygenase [Alphaproteobacteria bacterium]